MTLTDEQLADWRRMATAARIPLWAIGVDPDDRARARTFVGAAPAVMLRLLDEVDRLRSALDEERKTTRLFKCAQIVNGMLCGETVQRDGHSCDCHGLKETP